MIELPLNELTAQIYDALGGTGLGFAAYWHIERWRTFGLLP